MQSKKIILSMDWHDKDHQERGNLRNREITPAQLAAIQYILHSPDYPCLHGSPRQWLWRVTKN